MYRAKKVFEKFVKDSDPIKDMGIGVTPIFYAIIEVQNPYSSGSRGIEHTWCSSYDYPDITRSEFTKMAKRIAKNFAERKFYDTLKGGEKVKVFSDKEQFIIAANKVGIHPNIKEE